MTRWMSFVELDFLSLDCLDVKNTFYWSVYLSAAFPAALSVLNWVTYSFRVTGELALGYGEEARAKLWAEHMFAFLATVSLFLPACSQAQFEALDCVTLANDDRWLRKDTAVDCKSDSYRRTFRPIVIVLIMVFQSLPLIYIALLYSVRERLNPKMANKTLAMETRERDESLRPYRFLFSDYRLNRWYFDIVDLCTFSCGSMTPKTFIVIDSNWKIFLNLLSKRFNR